MHQPFATPSRRGFTLIELLVVITIIGILAAIALPNYIRAKDKAKEVQVKSSTKALQVAIERYHTDFEEYPLFLIGGDVEGWAHWHARYDEANPNPTIGQNAWVDDPLIAYSYMDSYPVNPFIDNGNAIIAQTGMPTGPNGDYVSGDGDPRFGFRGTIMGNGLENPPLFINWPNLTFHSIETHRTLTAGVTDPQVLGFGGPNIDGYPGGDSTPPGLHYTMAGRAAPQEAQDQGTYTIFTHWPGNFFYRSFSERWIARKGWTVYRPNDFVDADIARYIMGAYGALSTEGIDLISAEETNSTGQQRYYRLPPPWGASEAVARLMYGSGGGFDGGLPEIAGGGDDTLGPWLPPDRSIGFPGSHIYGAPDSHKDGVVLVLTAGEEVQAYQY